MSPARAGPTGLAGRDIDAVARAALWRAGLDYDHGTGHGVGAYLGVHEGPQSLSRRGLEPLLPGMILSIEPGYYREGAFGIRIENLGRGRARRAVPEGGDRPMLGFETLTLAPIDRRLIDPRLLDAGRARLARRLPRPRRRGAGAARRARDRAAGCARPASRSERGRPPCQPPRDRGRRAERHIAFDARPVAVKEV